MATETQMGQAGEGGESSNKEVKTKDGKLNINQRVDYLEKRSEGIADDFQKLEKNFQKLEKNIEKTTNIMFSIVSAIAIVFVVTTIMIGFDYLKNNEERYENFINKTEEIKQNFYTKEQVDGKINSYFNEIKNQFDNFKSCLKSGRYYQCF